MPKMKTRKALTRRFKLTASGKLKMYRAGRRHGLVKKTGNQKRKLRRPGLVSDTIVKTYKRLLCEL